MKRMSEQALKTLRANAKQPAAWGNYWAQKCLVLLNHINDLEDEIDFLKGKLDDVL